MMNKDTRSGENITTKQYTVGTLGRNALESREVEDPQACGAMPGAGNTSETSYGCPDRGTVAKDHSSSLGPHVESDGQKGGDSLPEGEAEDFFGNLVAGIDQQMVDEEKKKGEEKKILLEQQLTARQRAVRRRRRWHREGLKVRRGQLLEMMAQDQRLAAQRKAVSEELAQHTFETQASPKAVRSETVPQNAPSVPEETKGGSSKPAPSVGAGGKDESERRDDPKQSRAALPLRRRRRFRRSRPTTGRR